MAVLALGERRGINVVLDHELLAERRPKIGQHGRPAPAGQAACQRDRVVPRVVDAGAADDRLGD